MDFFNEYIVRKKKDLADILKILITIALGLMVLALVFAFGSYLGSLFLLAFVGVGYGIYYVISSLNVEFEYIFTTYELDVDKIISRRKRKRLLTVSAKDFEYFAPKNENHQLPTDAKIINAASSINAENAYFAVYHKNNEKFCLIFEPTDKMIKEIALYTPRSVYFTK